MYDHLSLVMAGLPCLLLRFAFSFIGKSRVAIVDLPTVRFTLTMTACVAFDVPFFLGGAFVSGGGEGVPVLSAVAAAAGLKTVNDKQTDYSHHPDAATRRWQALNAAAQILSCFAPQRDSVRLAWNKYLTRIQTVY